jgi:tRNA dimethylallyltransferase
MAYREIAIIGATASGKSSLSIEIAKKCSGVILSLDSLSIYKEIDIASAKPSKSQQEMVKHYGIDILYPNEHFDVTKFIELYLNVSRDAKVKDVPLIITGGSSFYLKMLIDGVSTLPKISKEIREKVKSIISDRERAYLFLSKIDSEFRAKDSYRLQKALEIYLSTSLTPTKYFKQNPPKPVITEEIDIFEIVWNREVLRDRIAVRTVEMVKMGLIDEVAYLEAKYRDRTLTSLKAIGIKEVFAYFDGIYSEKEMIQKIVINSAKLAKRQRTFNQTQFHPKKIIRGDLKYIGHRVEELLRD